MKNNIVTSEQIVGKQFVFSREKSSFSIDSISFLENGTIQGAKHPNESYWKVENGCLTFLNKKGMITTKFDSINEVNGKIVLKGKFLLKPHLNIIHQLTEKDSNTTSWWMERERHEPYTKKLFEKHIKRFGWVIGDHTYGNPRIVEPHLSKLYIGKFCSIASGVVIILGNHKITSITTYPFITLKKHWPNAKNINNSDHDTKGSVVIGNDVWIGRGSYILSGVNIGDGAVIGAQSVVTRDIPPYAICVGNPAKIVRYRFKEEYIINLLKIKWWNWDDEVINEMLPYICEENIDSFVKKFVGSSKNSDSDSF